MLSVFNRRIVRECSFTRNGYEILKCSENQITTFPLAFCGLTQLTVLNLAHNSIQEIPDGVGNLQVIELILSQNQVL